MLIMLKISGFMCGFVYVFLCVNRVWGQSAGQQWQLLLSWLPQWILGLYALHLENISHTRGKGMIMWKANFKML